MISKENGKTSYGQIRDDILFKIKNNIYKVGEQLPTNLELCDIYGVSRITVSRALNELENDGYIEKKQGKGCYVKFREINQSISTFYSFTEEVTKMGYVPSAIFISLKKELPTNEVAAALNLNKSDKVFVIKRLRLADDIIVAKDHSIIPEKFIPNFEKKMLAGGSLYEALENNYGFRPNHSEETIEAINISKDDAQKMQIEEGSPVLLIKRISFYNEIKVEFNYRIVNTKKFKYSMSLK